MRQLLAAALAALTLTGILAGCSASAVLPDEVRANDVLTMTPLDRDKMTITLRAEYNVNNEAIRSALAAKFPDVNFVSVFHCSQETQYELRQSLTGGCAEDLLLSPNMKSISDIAPDELLDLSAESFVNNYSGAALSACQLGGRVYYLPGPSSLYGIVYDRTLFTQNGWQVPHSYSEFLALVRTISASGIRAIQPTCKYARQAQMVLTMFDYAQTFGGVSNSMWLQDYQSGKFTLTGHLEPALARYQELQQAGVIQPEDFDVQPGNRSTMLYRDHTCAMILECEQAELYARQQNSDHTYGIFPFWCGDEANSDYLMSLPSYYIGVSRALAAKGQEKKLAKVKEVLSYISTPEGQEALNGGPLTQISNVLNTPYTKSAFNAEIQATLEKGNLVPEVDLMASGNNNPVEKQLKKDLPAFLQGKMDCAELTSDCDAARDAALSAGLDRGKKVGSAEATFSVAQTGLFIADALRAEAGADIGLCLVGTTHCGMVGRIYRGDVYSADMTSLSLSVGTTSGDPNDKKLWLVSMTGAELTALLRQAYAFDPQDNVPNIPYYVASGLKIRFAPWQEDKLVSVRLADGSALEQDKTYSVALWGWPFDSPCPGKVTRVLDKTSEEILSQAISEKNPLRPDTSDAFTLVYPS
jgi:raffinose/stachyose/melibiose transport system substrate-binding protein